MKGQEVGRLCAAIKRGRESLERFRDERREAVKQYVGFHWSEDGAVEQVPVNLIALYVEIVSRNLVSKNPRMMFSTHNRAAKPQVVAMESWMNDELENSEVANTLYRIIVDGLFSLGIAKVALATPADASLGGYGTLAGEPFLERVDLDDFVFDWASSDLQHADFIGHRYRAPLDAARSMYGRELEPSDLRDYNAEGDERIGVLGRGQHGEREEYEDKVDLWEVYCPRHKKVKTLRSGDDGMPMAENDGLVLHEQGWIGPDCGPYHFYSPGGWVPGNAMPKAPVQDMMDLHRAVNVIARKNIIQAKNQKRLTLGSGALTDAEQEAINAAPDGTFLRVSSLQGVMTQDLNGPNQPNVVFQEQLRNLWDWGAGNISTIGGLGPSAKTATQEKLISGTASQKLSSMAETTNTFISAVMKSLGWYHWHDPFRTRVSQWAPKGAPELAQAVPVTPMQRIQIPWDEVRMRVDPYSYRFRSPEQRAAELTQVMTQIVLPLAQALGAQGKAPDLDSYLSKIGKLLDMPDLAEVIRSVSPPVEEQGGPAGESHQRMMPTQTERSYSRESTASETPEARQEALGNAMQAAGESGQSGGY